ncbi:MAG: aminotransferase class III-fold pyridoxal phosphate-dependent enzyme [Gemmatimonadaceae bacterium]
MSLNAYPDIENTDWRARAAAVIPGGASTGSKRPEALFGSDVVSAPAHYLSAHGCTIEAVDGTEIIDCTMALGSVALGYGDAAVSEAVMHAASGGNVCGLSSLHEILVAERLCDVIPCAEKVRFLKTGAEAVAAAVRIARAVTGRDTVIGAGYFGWLDWCQTQPGVPEGARADFRAVPFDDAAALEREVAEAGEGLAAIVIEPVVERIASPEWIGAARRACDARGAVLIFDELKTGFRLRTGGYQALSNVTPDLACFGKAMANGFPLAAVVGRESVMDGAARSWISSTLASEAVALAAAGAVLDAHESEDICASLWRIGEEMRGAVARAITASGVRGVTVEGIPPMWFLRFDEPLREQRFLELALAAGVLFKRGAYNFAALAHDEDALLRIETAASDALVQMRDEGAPS